MAIQVGINGFGRIGRIVCRACLHSPTMQLSAINDPAISVEYICYLIKFDSTHGKLKGDISHTDNDIVINGKHIKVFQEKLPVNVPWDSAGVQYVVEASGMFTNQEKASGHLTSIGVKRVIVTAPSVDIPMILLGINGDKLLLDTKIISCASSTLYCLAPIIKVLEDNFGVEEGFLTSIHAMTPSLKPLDGLCLRGRHWRDHRSIHQNIIPATTGACKALGKILPQLKDKLSGLAFRVPIVNVSVLDLTVSFREVMLSKPWSSEVCIDESFYGKPIKIQEAIANGHNLREESRLFISMKYTKSKFKTAAQNVVTYHVQLKEPTTKHEIIKLVEEASKNSLKNIIKISNEESVSSDFVGESNSCILDANSSIQLTPNFYKIICWYENEYSYACRVLDTITTCDNQSSFEIAKATDAMQLSSNKINKVVHNTKGLNKIISPSTKAHEFINSDILSSTSQDTGVKIKLSMPDSLFIKKPSSATNPSLKTCRDRKRNELFKIWNDISENAKSGVRQNRCSFFQSCASQPPSPSAKIERKTQERIEKVKTEVPTMIDNTENLLNQTISPTAKEQIKDVNCDILKVQHKEQCVGTDNFKVKANLRQDADHSTNHNFNNKVEKCGDYISFDDLKNACDASNNCGLKDESLSVLIYDKEISKYSDNHTNKRSNKFNNITELGQNININIANMDKRSYKYETRNEKEYIQEQITATTLNTGMAQCIQIQYICNENKTEIITPVKKVTTVEKTSENTYDDYENPSVRKEGTDLKPNISSMKMSNIKVFEEELKKRNITLIDRSSITVGKNKVGVKTENTELDRRIAPKNLEITHSPNISTTDSELASRYVSCVNMLRSISDAGYENKQDIYDKLDSASPSDSNNSFEIYERKSQVIQITDLTKSLEDIGRLDKICRIIEISDELSDKLFSALDDDKGTEINNKRWSFKDLCMRIKLDEFCNKMFGANGV